jgi:manganese oxidase
MTEERSIGAIAVATISLIAIVLAAGALITTMRTSPAAAPLGPSSDATETVVVELNEFAITPANIQVAAGGRLDVRNIGAIEHDLEITDTGLGTPMLATGDQAYLDLSSLAPGTYEIHCTVAGHDTAGMTGTLTIVEGAGSGDAGDAHGGHELDWAALDLATAESLAAFPAETAGRGNQVLEPEEILADGTKVFRLVAEIIDWEVEPGKIVEGWAYNGQIPGPMFKLDAGDKVQVHVENKLPLGTDVHWHGVRVPFDQDGVAPLTQPLIASGDTYTYEFETTEPAIAMYHPHHHGMMKLPNGMFGVMIVGELGSDIPLPSGTIGGIEVPEDLDIVAEIPMVLNDAGTIGLSLNGKSFPATDPIVAKQGDWFVIHYYNEGLQVHPMHLHGPPQLVFAKDGFPLDAPQWEDTVNVAPGERYSVLVPARDPGVWALHCHILTHAERKEGLFGMVTALIVEE